MKKDKLGIFSINFARLRHTRDHEDNEPYIKASEAQMVYYVEDDQEQGWSIPIHLNPKDLYDMGENDDVMAFVQAYPSQNLEQFFANDASHIQLARITEDDDLEISNTNDDFNNYDQVLTNIHD